MERGLRKRNDIHDQICLRAGGPLSSISFAIEGVPPLNDSHCMHTELIPLLHIDFATFPLEW